MVTGRAQCMPLVAYAHLVGQDMWTQVGTDVAFQIHMDRVFGPRLLVHGSPKDVERSVTALHTEFNGHVWGL